MASVTIDLGVDGEVVYFDLPDEVLNEIQEVLDGYDYSQRV